MCCVMVVLRSTGTWSPPWYVTNESQCAGHGTIPEGWKAGTLVTSATDDILWNLTNIVNLILI